MKLKKKKAPKMVKFGELGPNFMINQLISNSAYSTR